MDESDSIMSASEIIKDRLYFVTFKTSAKPKNTAHSHYFCSDEKFVYESFYWDFGPLNICHVYNYCELVNAKLNVTMLGKRKIIHYTSASPQKRLNAAFLMGAYAIIELKKSAEEAYSMLTRGDPPPFMKFRDASNITPVFEISIQDCLAGLEKALKFRFFDIGDFYVDEYEYWERVEYGDLNWIVPGKFLAMCGPHRVAGMVKGYPQHAPESYFDYFRKHDVKHVVRLNCRSYDAKQFTDSGFYHLELFFPDGSCPNDAIMQQFLQYCEQTNHAIAVHCKAGLGRTGSLIGAYMVKHYKFTAMEAIAWLRLCRPGSVIGHQQRWLEEKEEQLWAEGEKYRKRMNISEPPVAECGIYSYFAEEVARDKLAGISKQVNNISLNDKTANSQDSANNNSVESSNDSNNNGSTDEPDAVEPARIESLGQEEEVKITRPATVRVTRSSSNSSAPKAPPRRVRGTITSCSTKTQGDELNEIKATRRRHTRSHNLDNANHHHNNNKHNLNADPTAPTTAVLQRFVAKIGTTSKGKDTTVATNITGNSGSATGGPTEGPISRRGRLLRIVSSSDKTGTSSAGSGGSSTTTSTTTTATVIGKNLRNSAHLLDSANNNSHNGSAAAAAALSSKQRNKRSIHERENSTAASKIFRRYASTTMAVQQKQKDPVHTSTLVLKKVTITPAATTAINSKTYPGPK